MHSCLISVCAVTLSSMSKPSVSRITTTRIPTEYGDFLMCYFSNNRDKKEHLAFYTGDIDADDVLVRVHSECFTGEVLGSLRCDCKEQLDRSLQFIADEGSGIVVYLRQEGRGIGLLQKMKAYNLQDQGHDTVDANLLLGHQADERDYSLAACILEELGVKSVRLMTNNPAKISALEAEGIRVNARIPLEGAVTPDNERYLVTKAQRMDHLLKMKSFPTALAHGDTHDPQSAD